MEKETIEKRLRELAAAVSDGRTEAVLTTANAEGVPHATWMGTVTTTSGEVLTITSPDSEKVANIKENANVEWMFSDEAKDVVIYLKGEAELVEDTIMIKKAWDELDGKRRAYFLNYFNSGIGFTVLRTRVKTLIYCEPKKNLKEELEVSELRA